MKSFVVLLLSLSFFFVACNDDYVYDSKAPEIEFAMPVENAIYSPGMPLDVMINISDDVFLGEFEFRLRGPENFVAAWDTTITYDLYGERSEILLELIVPSGLPSGKYNLTCTAYDARTRESESEISIFIQNSFDLSPPEISIDDHSITTFTGSAFVRVTGNISDNETIKTVRFEVWDIDTDIMIELIQYEVNTPTYEINEFIKNPLLGQYGETGQYDILIKAYDDVLNLSEQKVELFVE